MERLGNPHESANALTYCLQTRDTTRKTAQSMLEAAKSIFSKLLEETNDDLDRAQQPQEDQRAQATGNESRCSRHETSSKCRYPPTMTASEIPYSHFETEIEVNRSCSETISPSRVPLKYVASGDYHKQLVLSVSTNSNGGWKYEFQTSSLTTTILNQIFNEAEKNGKSHNFRTYIGQMVEAQTSCPLI